MGTTKQSPLVSVGITTYNRPEGLRQTLECITTQTYPNLEIIVSDNCSGGQDTRTVIQSFIENDKRIKYYRQETNIGACKNIEFVLEESTGEYFMWAADDDRWEPFFIQKCLDVMLQDSSIVAVTLEARYFSDRETFEFFPEGNAFYNGSPKDLFQRLSHMVDYYYGDLWYSLFKRSALFENGRSCFSIMKLPDLSLVTESPLFMFVAMRGQWKVLPEIGLYKQTTSKTYARERWRRHGGKLPNSKLRKRIRRFWKIYAAQMYELKCLIDAIDLLPIDASQKQKLSRQAKLKSIRHFRDFMIGSKKQTAY